MSTGLFHLFTKWGTDKVHHAHAYEILLGDTRSRVESVLEIGIGTMIPGVHSSMAGYAGEGYRPGGSLRAWRDYCPNAVIVGLDVQPDTQFATEDRIHTHLCDSTNKVQVDDTIHLSGLKAFDLIIDDGSHVDVDQLMTLRNVFPYLRPSGLYVIEDVIVGSQLYECPQMIEAIIGNNPYFAIPFSVGTERWNLIIIKHLVTRQEEPQ